MRRLPSNNYVSNFITSIMGMNLPIIIISITLGLFGVAMQYSASGGNMDPWAYPQAVRLVVGIGIMFFLAVMPQKYLFNHAYHMYVAGVILLILVEFFGHMGLGAQRWIKLGSITLQPSEPMKIFLIVAMAHYYHITHSEEVTSSFIPFAPLMIVIFPVLLVFLQPNLGTATIMLATGFAIMLAAGTNIWFFGAGIAIAGVAAPLGWNFLHDYQKARINTFLDPESDPLGAGYNIMQSKIAIGSGGFLGKGFLNGSQSQLSFLPEKQTDFIFTMVAEEFGLAGGMLLLITFATLISSMIYVACSSSNHFSRIMAIGVASMLFMHIFINIGMVMALLPVVGVPLPFLSYGGTMQLSTFAAIGLVLNAHTHREKHLSKGFL